MFFTTVVALTSVVASANAGLINNHGRRQTHNFATPATYDQQWLEPYQAYHVRYLALDCQNQHNTSFFDECCHPLLKTETLAARPAQCTPSPAASSSASGAVATSTVIPDGDGNDDDCDDEPAASSSPAAPAASSSPAAPAASSSAPAIAGGVGNVGGDPSPVASSTPAASSAAASTPKATQAKTSSEAQTTPKATSTSSSKKAAATSSASSGSGSSSISSLFSAFSTIGQIQQGGIGTFFFQNGVAGNCGTVHSDNDLVIALPTAVYGNGEHCGKKIAIADVKTGVTAVGTVADSCPTCDNNQCLDLSVALFNKFATANDGIFDLAWSFVNN